MKRKNNSLDTSLSIFMVAVLFIACTPSKQQSETTKKADSTWAMLPFVKADTINPILKAGSNSFNCPILKQSVKWEEKDVFNPAAVVRNNEIYLLYRAEDVIGKHAGTSRIGLAVSDDGLHFTKRQSPVLYPDNDSLKIYEWEGGIEDPRVVESEDSTYILTYTAYDGVTARLLLATSRDLIHWQKRGTVLNGKYKNSWSKSGAIVARQRGNRTVAEKINGLYWMYFGDTDLFIATSPDLLHWTPHETNGALTKVLQPRSGHFDSRLVESGPYALVQDAGIVLLYNGMNAEVSGDKTLPIGAYCGGQALFDKKDPTQLVDRLKSNFIKPDKPYEISGQINQVCFIEGMVWFKERWLLYYGTADSKIAVAVH